MDQVILSEEALALAARLKSSTCGILRAEAGPIRFCKELVDKGLARFDVSCGKYKALPKMWDATLIAAQAVQA